MNWIVSIFVLISFGSVVFCFDVDSSSEETAEMLHCLELKQKLFHSARDAERVRLEWERYLPVFLKTTLFSTPYKPADKGKEMEYPYGHSRFNIFGPIGPACRTAIESYGHGDDEKRACGLQQLQYLNVANTSDGKHDCVIYSVGSNNQWGFEISVVANTKCRVETFDCTVNADVRPPSNIANRVRLHRVCISDSDYVRDGRQYLTWKSVNKLTGIQNSPTFLKMDIEGYEFPVLRSIIDAGEYLPLQIAVEVHFIRFEQGVPDFRYVSTAELLAFMQYIYKFGGYYLIDRNDNRFCPHCTEIVLAKLNCHNHPKPIGGEKEIIADEKLQTESFQTVMKESFKAPYYH